jgi:hypothetical protein
MVCLLFSGFEDGERTLNPQFSTKAIMTRVLQSAAAAAAAAAACRQSTVESKRTVGMTPGKESALISNRYEECRLLNASTSVFLENWNCFVIGRPELLYFFCT